MASVGGRLDRVLADCFCELSRRAAKDAIAGGRVFVDGRRCRVASRDVPAGARVRWFALDASAEAERPAASGESELPVLYVDADVLVIDKPPGVSVNESETAAAASIVDRQRWVAPHVVHRLDRDTSGVLVLARHAEAARELSRAFAERRTRKIYWAIVTGVPPEGVETAAIGRDPRRPRARRVRPDGRPAETRFAHLGRAGDLSWVEAQPITGRTHQIRIHLAHRRAPVFGDLSYGGVDRARIADEVVIARRTALHARALEVELGGRVRRWEAPFPADLRELAPFDWDGVTTPSARSPTTLG